MGYYPMLYGLKIWLSTAFAAPLIYGSFELVISHDTLEPGYILIYFILVFFELLFSLLTWALFLAVIKPVVELVPNNIERKTLISTWGVLLTAATFYFFSRSLSIPWNGYFIALTAIYAGCIGAASWIFRLEPRP